MQIGVIYPQTELATEPATVRAYVRKVEELGYRHLEIYDHVLGADPAVHTGWQGPYDIDSTFHEPLVFFGFLAAITELELVTGIIIAPQRQTALLAKQAAEVDILSEGRSALGSAPAGTPWNTKPWGRTSRHGANAGRQIGLLRRLWTERSVTTRERSTRSSAPAGSAAGAAADSDLDRRACRRPRSGESAGSPTAGSPGSSPGRASTRLRAIITASAVKAGRDPDEIGMDGRLKQGGGGTDALIRDAERWRDAGATHVSVDTMGFGLSGFDAHLDALARAAKALGVG